MILSLALACKSFVQEHHWGGRKRPLVECRINTEHTEAVYSRTATALVVCLLLGDTVVGGAACTEQANGASSSFKYLHLSVITAKSSHQSAL